MEQELKEFFYQIKTLESSFYAKQWHCDVVKATNKLEAKKKVEADLGTILVEKVSRKKKKDDAPVPEFKIFIIELDEYWRDHWLTIRTCKVCSSPYSFLSVKQMSDWCNQEVCSLQCNYVHRDDKMEEYKSTFGKSPPCIYRIQNKKTELSYVGQTTQPVTLRWYQHLFHLTGTKFHEAVKGSDIIDWKFEVLEVVKEKEKMNEREQHWINHFNSISNGYNTATAKKSDENPKSKSKRNTTAAAEEVSEPSEGNENAA